MTGLGIRQAAAGVIAAANPSTRLVVYVSAGSITAPDGTPMPVYQKPRVCWGDVQPLDTGDIQHTDALNLQGVKRAIYINGKVDGLVRVEGKGGDLIITPDFSVWLVSEVVEAWPDWCKVVAVLQNQKDYT